MGWGDVWSITYGRLQKLTIFSALLSAIAGGPNTGDFWMFAAERLHVKEETGSTVEL